MKIPLPIFESLLISENTPPWVRALEECRRQFDNARLDYSDEEVEAIHNDLIEENYSYIKLGIKLKHIVMKKLYQRMGFKNFDDYCKHYLKKSSGYCRNIMRAAKAGWLLLRSGFDILPGCIAQASQLAKMISDRPNKKIEEEETKILCESWETILKASAIADAPITANFILKILEPVNYQPYKIKMDEKTYDAARELAFIYQQKVGVPVSANEYVVKVIQDKYYEHVLSEKIKGEKAAQNSTTSSQNSTTPSQSLTTQPQPTPKQTDPQPKTKRKVQPQPKQQKSQTPPPPPKKPKPGELGLTEWILDTAKYLKKYSKYFPEFNEDSNYSTLSEVYIEKYGNDTKTETAIPDDLAELGTGSSNQVRETTTDPRVSSTSQAHRYESALQVQARGEASRQNQAAGTSTHGANI